MQAKNNVLIDRIDELVDYLYEGVEFTPEVSEEQKILSKEIIDFLRDSKKSDGLVRAILRKLDPDGSQYIQYKEHESDDMYFYTDSALFQLDGNLNIWRLSRVDINPEPVKLI